MNRTAWLVLAVLATLIGYREGLADTDRFPSRPVRLVVPFPPGGSLDILARSIGERLSEKWSRSVVVDNRAGANGTVGADLVAKASPDGHTLLMGNVGTHGINPALYGKLPYDPIGDFRPVTLVSRGPLLLVVNPDLAARSVKELIFLTRAQPGKIAYGSAASSVHLAFEHFKILAQVEMLHVPYKGGGAAMVDLMAGRVHVFMASIFTLLSNVKAGKLRPLAVTTLKRSVVLPDVPTVAESGVPGYEAGGWNGVLAPAKTPWTVVRLLNRELVAVMQSPALGERVLSQGGVELEPSTPEQFAVFIAAEISKWGKVVKSLDLKPE